MRRTLSFLLFLFTVILPSANAADTKVLEEIAALRFEADSLHSIGKTDSAIILCGRAIELAEQSEIPAMIVGTHAGQGVFLRSTGKIDEALEHYSRALDIVTSGVFGENPDEEAIEEVASLYINLAVLNLDMAHKDEASVNASQAAEWIMRIDNPDINSQILGVAGSVLTGTGETDKALEYQSLAYDNALEAGNEDAAFRSAAYTLLLSNRMGKTADTSAWRKRCAELLPKIENTMSRLVYYQVECSIALNRGEQDKAIEYFRRILDLDGIDALPFVQLDCYNNMHLSYAAKGDYKRAYETVLKSNEIRDSLYEKDKAESLRELTVKYETKETELALSRSEAKRAMTLLWLAVAVGVLLVFAVIFIIYASRQRRHRIEREVEFTRVRANISQRLTEQYVEGLETERARMARELHDGVSNDLMAIQMRMNRGETAEDTARMIAVCRESVRRISHELMPPEFSYATIDEVIRYHIGKLTGAQNTNKSIIYESETDRDWNTVPDNIALEIYRIAQEAIGNALKHSGSDEIVVKMTMNGGLLRLTVTDKGAVSVPESSRGIGLKSINRRAGAIKGRISTGVNDNGGYTVNLEVGVPV